MIKLRNLHFNIKILHHDLSKKSLTYLERAQQEVPLFRVLVEKLTKNFSIQGKSSSTLHHYTPRNSNIKMIRHLFEEQCTTRKTSKEKAYNQAKIRKKLFYPLTLQINNICSTERISISAQHTLSYCK